MAAQGLAATALPLIDIRPAGQLDAIRAVQHELTGDAPVFQALMFVSAAAVNHFFIANNTDADCLNTLNSFKHGHTKAWATGQGTVQALLAVGVPASQIESPGADSSQWDSESLWARVKSHLDTLTQILIVRGADAQGQLQGRDWLAQQLVAKGIAVQQLAVYERHQPQWTPEKRATATQAAQGGLWVFSASEAITNLLHVMPDTSWQVARALTTHPRIAKAAQDAGFGVVCESLPGLTQVMASIKSLQ